MTAPPEHSADVRRPPAVVDEPSRDDLIEALRERLPVLAKDVLAKLTTEAELTTKFERNVPAADRGRVLAEVLARVVADGDAVLRDTNLQISALRVARRKLADHEAPQAAPAERRPSPRDRVGHATFGFVLWLGMIYPVLFWQLWQTPLTGLGGFGVFVAVAVSACFALRWAYVLVARAGSRFSGKRALSGAGWPFVSAFATTYLLLLWRLWTTSRDAMGTFWATLVWLVAGLFAFVLSLGSYLLSSEPLKDEETGRRLPRIAYSRGLLGGLVAVVVTYLLLSGTVPLQGPEWVTWLFADALSLLVFVLTGPLTLSSVLVPRRLSRDPGRRGSPEWTRRLSTLRKNAGKAEEAWLAAMATPVEQRVTHHLNEVLNPSFSTMLPAYDRGALGQMRAGDRVVTTIAAAERLRLLMAGIQGGAVGMAGPRGAGKSTLLEAYQAGKFLPAGFGHIAVLESVPVSYDAREFVLYLYDQVCAAVSEFCRKRKEDTEEKPSPWPARRDRWRWAWPFAAVVVLWAAVGFAGSAAMSVPRFDFGAWLATKWWPVVSVLGATSALFLAVRRHSTPGGVPARHQAGPPENLRSLRVLAEEAREEIEFQQKRTSGWSGKVGLPVGAEAGVTGSREVTRQPRTFPQIVREFSDFLRTTIRIVSALDDIGTPSVVIILDELDKIVSPDEAQGFVNQVKALFNLDVPGFLFLVSVSEDALASFERRGLPVRDAFDSAFDVIFRMEYLKLADARQVLSSRILGLPEPFVCLCHCMAGGLPRELIRVTRQVITESGSLVDVARRLVADDLAGKLAGLRTIVARGAYDDVLVSELVRHVDAHAIAEPVALVEAAAKPPIVAAATPDGVALHRLQVETLGYLYYLGTVLEVFGPEFSQHDLDRGRTEGDASFDTLTSVRQLFPVNARLAWLTISAFRESWSLITAPPPDPAP